MEPWVDTFGVVLVAGLGILLGRLLSGLKRPYWSLVFSIPYLIIAVLAAARFNQYISWRVGELESLWNSLVNSSTHLLIYSSTLSLRYVVLSFAIAMGLTMPLSRLPHKWEKMVVCFLMGILLIWSAVLPSIFPALVKGQLSAIETRFDRDGICRQTTKYTCGPAAAVTALDKLGLSAGEGEIAILSHTSPVTGTLPNQLCSALQSRFGTSGLKCQYRRFDSIEQLKEVLLVPRPPMEDGRWTIDEKSLVPRPSSFVSCPSSLVLAVVKDAFMLDHCVVVLEVGDNAVAVADPVTGKELIPYKQFEKTWRFSGIVMAIE